ncbi:MAG: hypothetical protein OEU26_06970 [Candidatus Tectomicrobia bacterium]|nr:hypothetical protein [Candidatus Tectomicrobia bacterium]
MNRVSETEERGDPLIDEIRAIRKAMSTQVGDDWEKLGEHVRKVGEEYRTKTGRFASHQLEMGQSQLQD